VTSEVLVEKNSMLRKMCLERC